MSQNLRSSALRALPLSSICLAVAFCLLPISHMATAADNELPVLGEHYTTLGDSAYEQRLGQAWLRHLRGQASLWPDSDVRDYVEGVIYRLAQNTPLRGQRVDVVIINDREINAFAVPGGIIGINTGLILNADNEDELASVLAHELGHISQRHFARSQEANKYNQWLALAGLLTSIAVASSGQADGALAAGASAQALAAQNQLAYSRDFEQEADRIGLQTLMASQYDGHAMPAFFHKLDKRTRQLGYMPEFLRTHPLSSTRLSDLSRRVLEIKPLPLREQVDFDHIKMRLTVAYHQDLRGFAASLDRRSDELSRYGLALTHLRLGQPDEAMKLISPLMKRFPERMAYRMANIDALLQKQRYTQALAECEQALRLAPQQQALLARAQQAALALNQANPIQQQLAKLSATRPNDPDLWALQADLAMRSGDSLLAFRARAEQYFFTNRFREAEAQLTNALKLANQNYSLRIQLQERLKQMRLLYEEFN